MRHFEAAAQQAQSCKHEANSRFATTRSSRPEGNQGRNAPQAAQAAHLPSACSGADYLSGRLYCAPQALRHFRSCKHHICISTSMQLPELRSCCAATIPPQRMKGGRHHFRTSKVTRLSFFFASSGMGKKQTRGKYRIQMTVTRWYSGRSGSRRISEVVRTPTRRRRGSWRRPDICVK